MIPRGLLILLLSVVVIPATTALALVPMAVDELIYDGPAAFVRDTWSHDFVLLSGRPGGLYLGVAGVERFQVLLNDSLLDSSRPGPVPRTLLRTMDLAAWTGVLMSGHNRLTLVATAPADSFTIRFWASPYSWFLGSSHNHTLYSDGSLTVHELMEWGARDGAWFMGMTDHNNLAQCVDSSFRRFGLCEPMRGTEWTVDSGHANLMGIQGQDMVPLDGPVYRMIDEARYRGALVQVNHPFSPDHRWHRAPVLDPGIDGIELLNGRMNLHSIEEPAIQWWHSLLVAGHAIPSLSSSDFHDDNGWEKPLKPCARVRATSNHPDTLLRAFKLGRVMSCDRHDGARVYIYADTSYDGRWDLAMGDFIQAGGRPRPVRFRVEAESVLPQEELVVLDRTGELFRQRFNSSGDFSREWTERLGSGDSGFVRAELRRANGRAAVLTNPIYINHPGYDFGPTEMRSRAIFLPGTTPGNPARLEPDPNLVRLELKLENREGYSPYEYGLAVALDTAHWELLSRQRQGPGIGTTSRTRIAGYHVLTWQGGYEWGNRLRPGQTVGFWAELRSRGDGVKRVLYRSWAHDRLFEFAADPDSGLLGPDGRQWYEQTVEARLSGPKTSETGPQPGERLTVTGLTLARSQVRLTVNLPGSRPQLLSLRLYDMTGRCRLMHRFRLPPGPGRSVEFELADSDHRRLPAGVYILRLSTGDPVSARGIPGQVVTRRLVVVE